MTPELPSDIERLKLTLEVGFRERELQLREREVEIRQKEVASSGWRSPLVVAIMAATLAGIGNASVALVNGYFQRNLESDKANQARNLELMKTEQARILEMIKTGDEEKAASNLSFLLKSHLITDEKTRADLIQYLNTRAPGTGPVLPAAERTSNGSGSEGSWDSMGIPLGYLPRNHPLNAVARAIGEVIARTGSETATCTGFLVSSKVVMTAAQCVAGVSAGALDFRLFDTDPNTIQDIGIAQILMSPRHDSADETAVALLTLQQVPMGPRTPLQIAPTLPGAGESVVSVVVDSDGRKRVVGNFPPCWVRGFSRTRLHYACDTGIYSAGAPILDAGSRVVGVVSGKDNLGGFGVLVRQFAAEVRLLDSNN